VCLSASTINSVDYRDCAGVVRYCQFRRICALDALLFGRQVLGEFFDSNLLRNTVVLASDIQHCIV
jgi:hypothetical protein